MLLVKFGLTFFQFRSGGIIFVHRLAKIDECMIKFGDDQDIFPIISIDNDFQEVDFKELENQPVLPLLALRNIVLFPGVVLPISVGREQSLTAIRQAKKSNNYIAVTTQKNRNVDDPEQDDLYEVGSIAKVLKVIQMPDGGVTAIVQGQTRMQITNLVNEKEFLQVEYTILSDQQPSEEEKVKYNAQVGLVGDMAERVVKLSPNLPTEATIALKNIDNDAFLLNFVASNMKLNTKAKQEILEMHSLYDKANHIVNALQKELNVLELKHDIKSKAESNLNEQQRNYYLNQQLKAIQEELGQGQSSEVGRLKTKAKDVQWNKEIQSTFEKELDRLQRLHQQSPEYSVQLNYLELMTDLPWDKITQDEIDIRKAKEILDRDHYGLPKVKKRILEYLAVLKLKGDMKSPILCFVGPPGVGKTSLGKSIAEALGREYIRMSLGGLHDESEIRGHRKTYIGSMPGRIIQSIKKAGTSNPVIVLDEIDKIGKDFRGDPSSALLEVLDPEQNSTFHDNYLDVDYDLSKVLFIATSNTLSTIQPALRDRMEIIEVSGYSQEEKFQIAKKHLIKKQRKAHGLKANQVTITKKTLEKVISDYTRESGVRNLDRTIASLMRYAAKQIVDDQEKVSIKPGMLNEILGPTKYEKEGLDQSVPPGVAVGLAWTQVGGDILYIEAVKSKGKGNLILTGKLGDVMKESAKTALSYIRSHANELNIDLEDFTKWDFHIHVPEGAVPKDGPSAGITILTTMTSLLKDQPVKQNLAMTGEITLRGKVLPVGGIKEKVLAANRMGIQEVILSKQNEKHVQEIEEDFIKDIRFHYVSDMMDVLKLAL